VTEFYPDSAYAKQALGETWRRREPEIEHFVMAITSAEARVRQLAPAKTNEPGRELLWLRRKGNCKAKLPIGR
jgi:hypothetical protein